MIVIEALTSWYELPADGIAAERRILSMLHSPGETWIKAYNFSLAPMFDEIRAASRGGVVGHCLLDHIQSTTPSEHVALVQLAKDCPNWDFTIATAAGLIEHDKAMVVRATDGGESECWSGSVNFCSGGFLQGNIAAYFRSNAWAAAFIAEFEAHRAWALTNEAKWQLP